MNYKFQAVRGILVAGVVASAYAAPCYVAYSASLTCTNSGVNVDEIFWADGTSDFVISTSAWTLDTVKVATTGPRFAKSTDFKTLNCAGPAKFTDPSGHVNTVNYWEPNSVSGGAGWSQPAPSDQSTGGSWGDVTTTTCT